MQKNTTTYLKASIGQTHFKCGKKNCRCTENKLHSAYYLSYRKSGKTFTVHIPQELVKNIQLLCKQWKLINKEIESNTHKTIQELLKSYRNKRRKGKE